jgi:hypothetical protein
MRSVSKTFCFQSLELSEGETCGRVMGCTRSMEE